MEIIKSSFDVQYDVMDFVIKTVGAGTMDGNKYGSSVKLTCTNLIEKENAKTNTTDEVIEVVEFKIPCETEDEARLMSERFKTMRKNGEIIKLSGSLPNQNGQVTVFTPSKELIGMKVQKSEKAS